MKKFICIRNTESSRGGFVATIQSVEPVASTAMFGGMFNTYERYCIKNDSPFSEGVEQELDMKQFDVIVHEGSTTKWLYLKVKKAA